MQNAQRKTSTPDTPRILLTNIETIPGHRIVEHYGYVSGNAVRAKNFGQDLISNIKGTFTTRPSDYTASIQEARNEAVALMVDEANRLGANAIVNVRFETSLITLGAAELYVYGTAVRIE